MLTRENQYEHWHANLAHRFNKSPKPAIHADEPMPGRYWERRVKNGPRTAVAIWATWYDDKMTGLAAARMDGSKRNDNGGPAPVPVAPSDIVRLWTWCADNPVTRDEFEFYRQNGHWPDEVTQPAASGAANGSNLPEDPFAALKAELDGVLGQAGEFMKAAGPKLKEKAQCERASNIAQLLRNLLKRAKAMHKEEKQPWDDGAAAIDAKFAFRKEIERVGGLLTRLAEAWMIAEESRQKAEAAAKAAAERQKREEDRKTAEAQDIALAVLDDLKEEPEPAPETIKVQTGGAYGSKTGLKSVWRAEITDWTLATMHYQDRTELRTIVQKLADKDADTWRSKLDIAGIEAVEKRKATK